LVGYEKDATLLRTDVHVTNEKEKCSMTMISQVPPGGKFRFVGSVEPQTFTVVGAERSVKSLLSSTTDRGHIIGMVLADAICKTMHPPHCSPEYYPGTAPEGIVLAVGNDGKIYVFEDVRYEVEVLP
jgi:hypothetical protein